MDLEYNDQYAIIHLPRVDKFGKTEYNLFKDYLAGLSDFIHTMGLSELYGAFDNKKIEKLAVKLGFDYLGESEGYKVYRYATSPSSSRSS